MDLDTLPDIIPAVAPIPQESESFLTFERKPAPFENPDWYELASHLEVLLSVVPETSHELERTTVLTWIYRNEGVLNFFEMVERVSGHRFYAVARRYARRAVITLCRIGAVRMVNITNAGSHVLFENIYEEERQTISKMNSNTHIVITRAGMSWMQRAFTARHLALNGRDYRLPWAHKVFLEEEEEGYGTEAHWIENLSGVAGGRVDRAPRGLHTAWIKTPITSVFDLGNALVKPASSKRTERVLKRA